MEVYVEIVLSRIYHWGEQLFPSHANVRIDFSYFSILILNVSLSFSKSDANPVYFLDVLKSQVVLKDVKANQIVASTDLSNFLQRPLQHSLTVTFGPNGNIDYQVTDGSSGAMVLGWTKPSAAVGSGGT